MTKLNSADWLTSREVADLLGINQRRVNQLIREGVLPSIKIGKGNLVRRQDLALAKQRRKPGRPKAQDADAKPRKRPPKAKDTK